MNVYLIIEAGDMANKDGYFGSLYWEAVVEAFSNMTKAREYCREQLEKIENDPDNEIFEKTENEIIYIRKSDGKKLLDRFEVKKMKIK